jgi:hypothetical protein
LLVILPFEGKKGFLVQGEIQEMYWAGVKSWLLPAES